MAKPPTKRDQKVLNYAVNANQQQFKSPLWFINLFPIVTARLDEIRSSFPSLDFTNLKQLSDLTEAEESHIDRFHQYATISVGLIRMSQVKKGEIHGIMQMVMEEQVQKSGQQFNSRCALGELALDWEKTKAPYSLANAGTEADSLVEYYSTNYISERVTFNRAQVQTIIQLLVATLNFAHQSFDQLAQDFLFDRKTLSVAILKSTLTLFVPCAFKGTYLSVFADAVSVTSLEQILSSSRSPLRWSIFSAEIGDCFLKAAIDEGIAEEEIEGYVMEGVNSEAWNPINNPSERAKKARSFFWRTADWYYRSATFTPHYHQHQSFLRRMKGQVERYRVKVISGNDANSRTRFTQDELDLCVCYVAELDDERIHYETLARFINVLLKKQLSLGFRIENSLRRKLCKNFLYLAAALKAFGKPVQILKYVDLGLFNSLKMEEVDDFAAQIRSRRPGFVLCSPQQYLDNYEPPVDDEDSDAEDGEEGEVDQEEEEDDDDAGSAQLSEKSKRGSRAKGGGPSGANGGGSSKKQRPRKRQANTFESDDEPENDSDQRFVKSNKRARGALDVSREQGEQGDVGEEQVSNRRKSRRNVIDYSKAYSADVEAALEALSDVSESDSGEENDSFEENHFESDAEHDEEEDVYADNEEDQGGMEEAPQGHREELEQDLEIDPFTSFATSQDARSSGSTPSLARSSPRDEHSMDSDDSDSCPTDSGAPPHDELERGQMKEDEENMGEESDAEDEEGDFVLSRQVQLAAMKATTCFQDLDEDEEFFQVGLNSLSESTLIAKIQHRSNASPDTPVWKICSEVLAEEWD